MRRSPRGDRQHQRFHFSSPKSGCFRVGMDCLERPKTEAKIVSFSAIRRRRSDRDRGFGETAIAFCCSGSRSVTLAARQKHAARICRLIRKSNARPEMCVRQVAHSARKSDSDPSAYVGGACFREAPLLPVSRRKTDWQLGLNVRRKPVKRLGLIVERETEKQAERRAIRYPCIELGNP